MKYENRAVIKDYDKLPSRGKEASDGERTSNHSGCGGRCYVFYDEERRYRVECEKCGTVVQFKTSSQDDAIKKWNVNNLGLSELDLYMKQTHEKTLAMEYRLLRNFISHMPKTYRKRNCNWVIVKDFLQFGTFQGGATSSKNKCLMLGIDPDGYTLERSLGE